MKQKYNVFSQRGSSLIEVLVTVLILSFGLLGMGAMLSYVIQLPKESASRSVAINVATDLVERMRANPSTWDPTVPTLTFSLNAYATQTFSASMPGSYTVTTCTYPNCSQTDIANYDITWAQARLNKQIAPAGITIQISNDQTNEGQLWVIWQTPSAFGSFSTASSDLCPAAVTALNLSPAPRCVYMPFKL